MRSFVLIETKYKVHGCVIQHADDFEFLAMFPPVFPECVPLNKFYGRVRADTESLRLNLKGRTNFCFYDCIYLLPYLPGPLS